MTDPRIENYARHSGFDREQRHIPIDQDTTDLFTAWMSGERDADLTPEDWAFGRKRAAQYASEPPCNRHGGKWPERAAKAITEQVRAA